MSATWELFERWKAKRGFKTQSEGSEELGLSRQTVQNWKEGRNGAPKHIEKMAIELGEDPLKIYIQAWAETSKDPADIKALAKWAKRLGTAVVALALLSPINQGAEDKDIYIMRNRHRGNRRRFPQREKARWTHRPVSKQAKSTPARKCSTR